MQPRPTAAARGRVPEFMWCQRSDRVYVTIKVADCTDAQVRVTPDHTLEFTGHGHGSAGTNDYALSVALAGGVVADQCAWFACGPGVRVRLQKAVAGPHWLSLLRDGVKMVQCKVDWSSWLDEDEETEVPR